MIIPILRIFDKEKADDFYLTYLGFQLDWSHQFEEHLPFYLQVSKESAIIHLSEHHGDASPGSAIRIKVTDLSAYHTLLSSKEYRYARPAIERQPWGAKEMTIVDPFFNRLIFYEDEE